MMQLDFTVRDQIDTSGKLTDQFDYLRSIIPFLLHGSPSAVAAVRSTAPYIPQRNAPAGTGRTHAAGATGLLRCLSLLAATSDPASGTSSATKSINPRGRSRRQDSVIRAHIARSRL